MTIKLNQVLAELREDHRNLSLLLDLLESESEGVTVDDEPDFELLHDIMQYMTVYSDAVHHPKEDLVYKLLRDQDVELTTELEQVEPEHRDIAELGRYCDYVPEMGVWQGESVEANEVPSEVVRTRDGRILRRPLGRSADTAGMDGNE